MYLCQTELFEIEQFWHSNCELILNWIVGTRAVCMKMDLELNNL